MVRDRGVIDRKTDLGLVRAALKRSRVVALLGPRQCGKTTLARQLASADSLNYFDLEDPQSLARLSEPDIALRPLKGLVVIDEVQRECKRADAPRLTPSMRIALTDLKLDELHVVYPGAKPYALADRIQVVPLAQFVNAK
jgi:ATP-dependent protease Clp ATPase subunit